MEKLVTIYRGLPGAGKSTWARIEGHDLILEADSFFIGKDGIYRFDRSRLNEAHKDCVHRFLEACSDEVPRIAVANTNCATWEWAGYAMIARAFDYEVEVVTIEVDQEAAIARNIHGCPALIIDILDVRLKKGDPFYENSMPNLRTRRINGNDPLPESVTADPTTAATSVLD